jgi:dihydrofolate reductase
MGAMQAQGYAIPPPVRRWSVKNKTQLPHKEGIMAKLIYGTNTSLDGYISDPTGSFDWGEPSEQLHEFFNDLLRPIGTYLYGRALYEVMSYWETALTVPGHSQVETEFAQIWQNAEKIVYSTTLTAPSTNNTRIERSFDSEAVRHIKATTDKDMSIGGAQLAAEAFRVGLIDECHLIIHPVIVGGGKPALPTNIRLDLELLDEQRFDGGVVRVHYRVK